MKKILKPILMSLLIVLAASIGFFMALSPLESKNAAQAAITGVSGAEIHLTSRFGTTPTHAFLSEDEESTLVAAQVSDKGERYINRDGNVSTDFFAIQSKSPAASKYSYGYAEFKMTEEMTEFAKKGILYVQASAGIVSRAQKENSNVIITISQGDISKSVKSDYTVAGAQQVKIDDSTSLGVPQWIETEFIKVGPEGKIVFNFSSAGRGSWTNACEFSIIEPKLVFRTIISKVEITDESEKVSAGQVLKLSGTNEVVSFTGKTDYLKYYRAIHAVKYEIVEGGELGKIVDGYLYVGKNATEGVIKIRAKSLKDSLSDEWIYSEIKEYTVSNEKIKVEVTSNFANPATFYGEGEFLIGKKTTLIAKPNDRYTFDYWMINGEKFTSKRYILTVTENVDVQCFFKKSIFIKSVTAQDKIYDRGTYVVCDIEIDGIERYHGVYMEGLTTNYESANVGEHKKVIYGGSPKLFGKDKNYYTLVDLDKIPDANGNITKREVTITTSDAQKVYGSLDDVLSFKSSIEEVNGRLGREAGEDVGKYKITIGNLNEQNPNYDCKLSGDYYYTIVKRNIEIGEIKLQQKVYDKTKNAVVEKCELTNIAQGDEISLDLQVEFTDINAGERELRILKSELVGDKKGNYNLVIGDTIYKARILQKDLTIVAKDKQSVFGDEIDLEYDCSGLLEGDSLTGGLEIDSRDVGTYIIQNKFSNPNYNIKYTSASCVIKPRDIKILAQNISKTYGDNDPYLNYLVENIVEREPLEGSLIRESGEKVGEYQISIGSLRNTNYNIVEFTPAKFVINKKEISLNIQIENKAYDGTKVATFNYYFSGIVGSDQIEYNATMEFESCDAGEDINVIVKNSYFLGEQLENYEIISAVGELKGRITRKDVFITPEDKEVVYGDEEAELSYKIEGMIEGETLSGSLARREGRDAGTYEILLNDITNENNKNYNIISKKQAYYTILTAALSVKAIKTEKIYGEEDPRLEYILTDLSQLKYEDSVEDLFIGELTRDEGEIPGRYTISLGSLECKKNYTITSFDEDYFIIQKRDIVVQAIGAEKIYGDEDPEFTYITENKLEEDNLSIKLKRSYGEEVGKYEISYTSLTDPRYNITFESAELEIKPRAITIKADDKYKEYGEADPEWTVSVIRGELGNDDDIENIERGKMLRLGGENVGEYTILQGSYSFGENYTITFESGKLNVLKVSIEITADKVTKKYGNKDGELTYTITKGSLKGDDELQGSLVREEGEQPGQYAVSQGSLAANDNYEMSFAHGLFIIEKRPIVITANPVTKVFGDEDPVFTYTLSAEMCEGDSLQGSLDREKPTTESDSKAYEKTGRYLIYSTLYNDNYEITFIPAYLTIQRREIVIRADNKEKTYGEADPELSYTVESGTILEGDTFMGDIYRVQGDNAGTYDIRSNLSLGRNYKITFIKGSFVIKPIDIYVKTYDYTKVYGDINPSFEYEITEGQLLRGDVLLGGVSKEEGETVGKYRLVSAFNNVNYNVILTENYMTITPKKAYLSVNIQDKVYNGDLVAYIKNPVVSGLIDENIKLSYDKENCARFEYPDVANDVNVCVYGISLVGNKAENYELVYPKGLKANISHNEIESDQGAKVISVANTSLTLGTELKVEKNSIDVSPVMNTSKQLVSSYKLSIENNDNKLEIKDSLIVSLEIPREFRDRSNFYVYGKNKKGEYVLLSSERKGNALQIVSDNIDEFIILSDNEKWIDIGMYVSIGVIGAFLIFYVTRTIVKNGRKIGRIKKIEDKKNKKSKKSAKKAA